jgi:hypothetical protein
MRRHTQKGQAFGIVSGSPAHYHDFANWALLKGAI